MSVISGHDYYTISVDYTEAMDLLDGVSTDLYSAVYTVVMMQQVNPEVDLLSAFYSTYQLNSGVVANRSTYLSAIRALQLHVLTRSGRPTVSDFIANVVPGRKVSAKFADLSSQAGYPLDPSVIE